MGRVAVSDSHVFRFFCSARWVKASLCTVMTSYKYSFLVTSSPYPFRPIPSRVYFDVVKDTAPEP